MGIQVIDKVFLKKLKNYAQLFWYPFDENFLISFGSVQKFVSNLNYFLLYDLNHTILYIKTLFYGQIKC